MKKIVDFFEKTPITKFLACILIMAMAVVMTMNVILRYCFGFSFNWGDEIIRYMSIYCSFLGMICAFRTGDHIGITVFVEKMFPEVTRKYFRLLGDIITIVFLGMLTWFGFVLIQRIMASGQTSAALHLPMWLIYGIVPICSLLSIIQVLIQIFRYKSFLKPRE